MTRAKPKRWIYSIRWSIMWSIPLCERKYKKDNNNNPTFMIWPFLRAHYIYAPLYGTAPAALHIHSNYPNEQLRINHGHLIGGSRNPTRKSWFVFRSLVQFSSAGATQWKFIRFSYSSSHGSTFSEIRASACLRESPSEKNSVYRAIHRAYTPPTLFHRGYQSGNIFKLYDFWNFQIYKKKTIILCSGIDIDLYTI